MSRSQDRSRRNSGKELKGFGKQLLNKRNYAEGKVGWLGRGGGGRGGGGGTGKRHTHTQIKGAVSLSFDLSLQ